MCLIKKCKIKCLTTSEIVYWVVVLAELELEDLSVMVAVVPATWVSPVALASVRMTVVDVDVKRRFASSAPKLK